jgi:Fe-Mn family superoxide dismutase
MEMAFELPALPYAKDALAPAMSAETLDYHHGKHHNKYVNTLNDLIKGTEFEGQSLDEIIKATAGKADKKGIFNNAAQHFNHSFFWTCMTPNGGGKPTGDLARKIDESFGDFDSFRKKFAAEAGTHFGSGWAWLVADGNGLKVISTHDAENPIHQGLKPILTCDVWEHAYYIDYRNERPKFVDAFLDKLVNWDFAARQL